MPTTVIHPAFVCVGEMATFGIKTTLPNPTKYQWMRDGIGIAGAPSAASYTTYPLRQVDMGKVFSCRVSSEAGTETSDGVVLVQGRFGEKPGPAAARTVAPKVAAPGAPPAPSSVFAPAISQQANDANLAAIRAAQQKKRKP